LPGLFWLSCFSTWPLLLLWNSLGSLHTGPGQSGTPCHVGECRAFSVGGRTGYVHARCKYEAAEVMLGRAGLGRICQTIWEGQVRVLYAMACWQATDFPHASQASARMTDQGTRACRPSHGMRQARARVLVGGEAQCSQARAMAGQCGLSGILVPSAMQARTEACAGRPFRAVSPRQPWW
jgi:hypothetical protein